MNRNWSNQKTNPTFKTIIGGGKITKITNRQYKLEQMANKCQLFPKRWSLSNPNRTKSIMSKHKVKYHRYSDTKQAKENHIRTTALERSVMNYWGLNRFYGVPTSPSVTDVVQPI